MTTVKENNVYNLAIEGNFDDCQKLVKSMFIDQSFNAEINMSGVNSINWARIIPQIVYYFFVIFKLITVIKKLIFLYLQEILGMFLQDILQKNGFTNKQTYRCN
jgi:threonine synthase